MNKEINISELETKAFSQGKKFKQKGSAKPVYLIALTLTMMSLGMTVEKMMNEDVSKDLSPANQIVKVTPEAEKNNLDRIKYKRK